MTQIFIVSGTTWVVPGDWNNASNSIEVIGGGGGARGGGSTQTGGAGGGAYSAITNATVTAGTRTVQVGAKGTGGASDTAGTSGTDTWVRIDASAVAPTTTAQGVLAKAGLASTIQTGGAGGPTATGVGTTKFAGGAGGTVSNGGLPGGGGGGAAGPNGAGTGGAGGGETGTGTTGAPGGGGGGGGSAGTSVPTFGDTNGKAGGNNSGGTGSGGGGAGGTNGTAGTNGTNGGGGGGGGGGTTGNTSGKGGNGGAGTEWDSTHGSGGAGGGGGGIDGTSGAGVGGTAGNYGGGGGGGGSNNNATGGVGGDGAPGLIAITYTASGGTTPSGSSDYYAVPPVKQAGINTAQPHLLMYESYPAQGLVPSTPRPSGESAFYDVEVYPKLQFRHQHDAYDIRFVQQNPPPGSGGFPWYYDRAVYPKLRFRDQHETYPARGNVPSPPRPSGESSFYDVEVYPKLRFRDQHEAYPARNIAIALVPSGSVSFFDFDKYPALQFRHQHESYPALGLVPTAATAQGWTAFYDIEAAQKSKAGLADHESAEFTFFPSRPLWTDYYDAEVIKGRARDYSDSPAPTTQVVVVATGWGAFYDSNLNLLPPRRAAEGAVYDVEPPEPAATFVEVFAYFDRARLRPILTQQHETYPALGLVATAATPQGWWLPLDAAIIRPLPASRQQFDGYQHFIPPVAVNLGPLGWSMFWDKGRRPLSPDRMPFLFEQLWQFPTAATPQGWTHLLDAARVKPFPAHLQQYDGLGRLSFPAPFVGVTFERFDLRVIRPRPFPYSVVDQQPTVVVPPSAYVLFPELFKRPRPFPYVLWPEQRVAVFNTPAGAGGPTYYYDRRLAVMHRPIAEVVPFDGRGLPFVVVNLIIHHPGKSGLLTPQVLVATNYQPTLSGIKATTNLSGEVED